MDRRERLHNRFHVSVGLTPAGYRSPSSLMPQASFCRTASVSVERARRRGAGPHQGKIRSWEATWGVDVQLSVVYKADGFHQQWAYSSISEPAVPLTPGNTGFKSPWCVAQAHLLL